MNVELFLSVLSFFWGACVGSFLNVCIYRIPAELSVVTPRSHCPHCQQPIAWYDNIPLVSFFVLRARCRHCSAPIAPRYVLVEFLTACLFLLVWLKFLPAGAPVLGLAPAHDLRLLPVYWLAVSGLILGTFVDFEHMIIPDRVTWGGIVAGLILGPLVPSMHGEATAWGGLRGSAIGAAVGFGILWTVAGIGKLLFRKDAMGFGDVKLMGAIGAFLGWWAVLFTLIVSSFAGSVVGVTLIATGRREFQGRIPYGPYLALAAILWILWGPCWRDLYLGWLMASPVPQ